MTNCYSCWYHAQRQLQQRCRRMIHRRCCSSSSSNRGYVSTMIRPTAFPSMLVGCNYSYVHRYIPMMMVPLHSSFTNWNRMNQSFSTSSTSSSPFSTSVTNHNNNHDNSKDTNTKRIWTPDPTLVDTSNAPKDFRLESAVVYTNVISNDAACHQLLQELETLMKRYVNVCICFVGCVLSRHRHSSFIEHIYRLVCMYVLIVC